MIGTYFYEMTARGLTGGFQILARSNTLRITPFRSRAQTDSAAGCSPADYGVHRAGAAAAEYSFNVAGDSVAPVSVDSVRYIFNGPYFRV